MTPRERARWRLQRRTPGQDCWPEGPTALRLVGRGDDDTVVRASPSDSLSIPEEVRIKALRTIKPEPNAPLLMRLVREPFALDTVRAQRVPFEERAPRPARDVGLQPLAREIVREERVTVALENPMRRRDQHPVAPPRPFARARARSREGRDEQGDP